MAGRKGWVYILRCEQLRVVKIGWSDDPTRRHQQIAGGFPYPITLEAAWRGTTGQEAALHHRFNRHRLNGEWFKASRVMERFIARKLEQPGTVAVDVLQVITPQTDRLWLRQREEGSAKPLSPGHVEYLVGAGRLCRETADRLSAQ